MDDELSDDSSVHIHQIGIHGTQPPLVDRLGCVLLHQLHKRFNTVSSGGLGWEILWHVKSPGPEPQHKGGGRVPFRDANNYLSAVVTLSCCHSKNTLLSYEICTIRSPKKYAKTSLWSCDPRRERGQKSRLSFRPLDVHSWFAANATTTCAWCGSSRADGLQDTHRHLSTRL